MNTFFTNFGCESLRILALLSGLRTPITDFKNESFAERPLKVCHCLKEPIAFMNGFYCKSCGYQSVNKCNTYHMCVLVNKYAFEESFKSCSRDQDLCSVLGPGTKSYREGNLNSSNFSTTFH